MGGMNRTILTITTLAITLAGIGGAQDAEEYKLELRLLGAHAFGSELLQAPSFSAGAEGAFRLTNVVSLIANYHHIGTPFCFSWDNCTQPVIIAGRAFEPTHMQINYEVMGGVRLSLPNRTGITPYVSGVAGGVNYSYGSTSYATPAVAIGADVDYRLTSRLGITSAAYRVLDTVPIYGGHAFPGYGRMDAGVYFRF